MLTLGRVYERIVRLFHHAILIGCLLFMGVATAPAFAGTNFGAVAVGTSTSPVAVTITFSASATLGTVNVVTQGANGLDFQGSGGGTCATGTGYVSGQSCTVNVVFTPKAVGQRMGAVLLYDNAPTPNLLATAFLSGIGNGGLLNFYGGQITFQSGLNAPHGVAVDGFGSVYVGDSGNNRVVKIPFGGGVPTTVGSGLSTPAGVSVDGAGNVYIADISNNRVVEVPAGGSPQININTGSNELSAPQGVAVDGAGNLYIADTLNSRVLEVPANGGAPTVIANLSLYAYGIAVDPAGNLYVAGAKNGTSNVVEIPAGGGSQTTIGTGLNIPQGVAVDAAGNVYIADGGNSRVLVVSPGTGNQTMIGAGLVSPVAVAVDGSGNVYIADSNTASNLVVEVQQANIPKLNFPSVTVGSSMGESLSLSNIGNTPVALNSVSISPVSGPFTVSSNSCGGSIGVGVACSIVVGFTPTTGSPGGIQFSGSLTLTDNASFPSSPQTITLNATAVQVPTQLFFSTPPLGTILQGNSPGDVLVAVRDNTGNPAPNPSSSITLTVTGPSNYSQTYVATTESIGYASFSPQSLSVPGTYIYTATGSGLTSTTATETVLSNSYALPSQAVNSSASPTTVTLAFSTSGQVGAIRVVTQGAAGLDFQQATTNGGTCAVGTLYPAGQSCTVNVVFTPKGVGQRLGAVLLYDSTSPTPNLLATAFLSGIGNGGLLSFSTIQTTVGSGLGAPFGVAVDGAGNVYAADLSGNRVVKVPAGGGAQTVVGSGLNGPTGVAVDGAGNVYIAAGGGVVAVPVGCSSSTCQTTVGNGLSVPWGVAVDGAGDIYITDIGNNNVVEVLSGGAQMTIGSGLKTPYGVAADGMGNIYIADTDNGRVVEVPVGGGAQTVVASGLFAPYGVAVDGAGSVYIANAGGSQGGTPVPGALVVVPVGCSTSTCQMVIGSGSINPADVALDGVGNIYLANLITESNGTIVQLEQTQLPSTIGLGSVTVGAAPGTNSVSFTNIGNAPLLLSSATSPSQYSESDSCNASVPVSASCTLKLSFTPTTGTVSPGTPIPGTLTLTDNAPNSPQAINLTASAVAIPPSITTQPQSQTINSGQSATLTVVATGTAPLTYQWYSGTSPSTAAPVPGATVASFTIPTLTASTSYWVQVMNTAGSANSNTATITVITPPTIAPQPQSQTINSGQTATFTVVAAGTLPLTYQWYQGSASDTMNLIPGATGSSYTTSPLTTGADYWVRVRNSAGTVDSTTLLVTVIGPAAPAVFQGQPSNTQFTLPPAIPALDGTKVTLSCTLSGIINGQTITNADPSLYGITCNFPAAVTLSTTASQVPVTILTTGPSSVSRNARKSNISYALALPLPGLMFLGFGTLIRVAKKRRRIQWMNLFIGALLLSAVSSCGGHFTPPTVNQPSPGAKVTPAGSYQITIITNINPPPPGFVQSSLIVPLVVVSTSH